MKIKVNVTQDDIDNGVRCNPCSCPVARALRREGYKYADVNEECAEFMVGPTWKRAELPKDVKDRIWEFDLGGRMEPFECELEAL